MKECINMYIIKYTKYIKTVINMCIVMYCHHSEKMSMQQFTGALFILSQILLSCTGGAIKNEF